MVLAIVLGETWYAFQQAIEGDMGIEVGGILGLIVLILDVWAIVRIVGASASTGAKVLWIVVILLLPVLGFLIWLLAGPK